VVARCPPVDFQTTVLAGLVASDLRSAATPQSAPLNQHSTPCFWKLQAIPEDKEKAVTEVALVLRMRFLQESLGALAPAASLSAAFVPFSRIASNLRWSGDRNRQSYSVILPSDQFGWTYSLFYRDIESFYRDIESNASQFVAAG
jgi:hypothetical protein